VVNFTSISNQPIFDPGEKSMALSATVTGHTAIGAGGTWTDPNVHPPVPIATSCHFATTYWAFRDEFNRAPTLDDILRIGVAQAVLTGLIHRAARKNQPVMGNLNLTPGSVLIFVDDAHLAAHSCVATAAQSIGGYNQMGWYSAGGGNHTYSNHTTAQLQWGNLGNRNKVHRVAAAGWFELYELPEIWLKATIRGLIQ
jgi:hypothetical protein